MAKNRTKNVAAKSTKRPNLPARRSKYSNTDVTDAKKDVTDPNTDVTGPNTDVTDTKKDVTDPNIDVTNPNTDVTDKNTENYGFQTLSFQSRGKCISH